MSSGEEIRLGLGLQYDGAGFSGWQVQKDRRTVQGEIEAVVERLTGRRRPVTAAGRTDRGVHATGQVAAVTLPARWTPDAFRKAANALLPGDVWVEHARRVDPRFHPRYDAVSRTYLYYVGLAREASSPFHRRWCWPLGESVDRALLSRAAAALIGVRSFLAFAKTGQPERGELCAVHAASWEEWRDLGLVFSITANRYLHHMVRYLVGTMIDVGRGRRSPAELSGLLEAPTGGLVTSPPAPPEGLFLARVAYPAQLWPLPDPSAGVTGTLHPSTYGLS